MVTSCEKDVPWFFKFPKQNGDLSGTRSYWSSAQSKSSLERILTKKISFIEEVSLSLANWGAIVWTEFYLFLVSYFLSLIPLK